MGAKGKTMRVPITNDVVKAGIIIWMIRCGCKACVGLKPFDKARKMSSELGPKWNPCFEPIERAVKGKDPLEIVQLMDEAERALLNIAHGHAKIALLGTKPSLEAVKASYDALISAAIKDQIIDPPYLIFGGYWGERGVAN
jgi:hypothetical protein